MTQFSNPRLSAEFPDWPNGGFTCQCKFAFEHHPSRGMRIVRTTTNKAGGWCKPKCDTYGGWGVIVDGADGKTYILQYAKHGYHHIYVKQHDFLHAECVHPGSERFEYLKALIVQGNA